MAKRRVTHARIYEEMNKELTMKWPNVKKPDLLQMIYDNSLFKLEAKLIDRYKNKR